MTGSFYRPRNLCHNLLPQADRDTAAWEAEQLRVRNGELDAQLATAQAEADEQRAAKDDTQAALARARSRIEDLSEEVMVVH
jgi:chromosome segregation ATPase